MFKCVSLHNETYIFSDKMPLHMVKASAVMYYSESMSLTTGKGIVCEQRRRRS